MSDDDIDPIPPASWKDAAEKDASASQVTAHASAEPVSQTVAEHGTGATPDVDPGTPAFSSSRVKIDDGPSLFKAPPIAEQERMVEAMLFASADPLTIAHLGARMPHGCDAAEALTHLRKRYQGRGVRVVKVGEAWAIRTAPDLAFLMQAEVVETRKLSRAAIETLAIIAYHQPVTRAEIEEIRGVSVSRGTLDLLIELDWIKLGRRRMTPGRPVTFVATQIFLDHFGLESARDLPGLAELRSAGLLDSRMPPGREISIDEDEDEGDDDANQGEMFDE